MVLDVNAPGLPAHGAAFHSDRQRSLWLPAGPGWLALAGTPDYALRNSLYGAIAFDKDTAEAVAASFIMPHDFASGFACSCSGQTSAPAAATSAGVSASTIRATAAQWSGLTTFDTARIAAPSQNVWKYTASSAAFPNTDAPGQHVLISVGVWRQTQRTRWPTTAASSAT